MSGADHVTSAYDPSQQLIGEPIYRETQRTFEWWVYALVAIIPIVSWVLFVGQIVLKQPLGSSPASDTVVLVTWAIGGLVFPAFMMGMRLVAEVWPHELRIRWIPIWKRTVAIDQIVSAEPVVYRPLLDCGGWGIRLSRQYGWAYTMSGREGVVVALSDGKKLLVGSKKPAELAAMIERQIGGPA